MNEGCHWQCGVGQDAGRAEDAVGVGVDHRSRGIGPWPAGLGFELAIRTGRVDTLQHVDHDDGHVVAAPVGVGFGHELVRTILRIAGRHSDGRDLIVVHLVDQTVAAEYEAIAVNHRNQPGVDADGRLDAERASDDVAPRVGARLVFGDVAGVDQLLHVG